MQAGDLFVARPGRDNGHQFVAGAVAAGAAGALVSHAIDTPHVLVADNARALEDLGRAARPARAACIIGVPVRSAKASTKEGIYTALERIAAAESIGR